MAETVTSLNGGHKAEVADLGLFIKRVNCRGEKCNYSRDDEEGEAYPK
jgi:hypothetical protein